MSKLTDDILRCAAPREKLYKLYDGNGLFVEVPSKGAIRWRVKYSFKGRENRLSVGTYPMVSIGDARKARDGLKELIAQGIDPASVRKQKAKDSVLEKKPKIKKSIKAKEIPNQEIKIELSDLPTITINNDLDLTDRIFASILKNKKNKNYIALAKELIRDSLDKFGENNS